MMDDPGELLTRRKLSVFDYYRMAEIGILGPQDRVELIRGEIVEMAAIGVAHASIVDRITWALVTACGERAIVRVQNPVRLDEFNEPQPDFSVLKRRADFYATGHPGSEDVLLLVEVADSSLRYDRGVKLPLYAAFGIPEVWIVDVNRRTIHLYRQPGRDGYALEQKHAAGDTLHLTVAPEIALRVEALTG